VNLLYLHGFASSPQSTKAQFFRARLEELGLALEIPDLAPDFAHMTITSELAIVARHLDRGPAVLFGSSLGGYVAALAAERWPERARALVLFAPAFGFAERWESRLGLEEIARWRVAGTRPTLHYSTGREEPLSIELLDDARRHASEPAVGCPCLIFAGRRDDAVPLEVVERFAAAGPRRTLYRYDAGHELTEVLAPMWERTREFLHDLAAP
jgi:pimeloyl-ACP methyl ester carboxylesterase